MSDDSWLSQSRKKKTKNRWTLILAIVVLVAAGIFLKNNHDLLWSSKDRKNDDQGAASPIFSPHEDVKPEPVKPAAAAPVPTPAHVTEKKAVVANTGQPLPGTDSLAPGKESPKAVQKSSVLLSDIRCFLRDRKGPGLVLSLNVVFEESGPLKQEVLVKRDVLKVMIKKVMADKTLEDMKVDSLRLELKNSINALLESGKISDLEFNELRIDKAK
jgi:flagellar basal body-associated protein FliL